jgi:phosphate:Na+ symporter
MLVTLAVHIIGGIGLFILGMILMTDGLKTLAGDTLRNTLSRFTGGRFSSILTGIGITALMQSSHATLITTIGFVSAGLLTFEQSIGIVIGSHIGTTSTGWLVAVLGLKMKISMISLPILGIGAMMRLLGREKTANIGLIMAGFGLIFLGIDTLQTGMKDLTGKIDLSSYTGATLSGRIFLVALGIGMTIVMQSSSAAITMTLAALNSGTLNLEQSAALVVGQNVGTTLTAAIAAIGASTPAKRTAASHIIFNAATAIVVFFILPWFVAALEFFLRYGGITDPTLVLPAFHTAFNILGMFIALPIIRLFSRLVTILIPDTGPVLTRHLDNSVTSIPAIAIEAARRTARDITIILIEITIENLTKGFEPRNSHRLASIDDALAQTRIFLSRVRSEKGSTSGERSGHVSVLHIIDHAENLSMDSRETEHIQILHHDDALNLLSQELCDRLRQIIEWMNNPGTISGEVAEHTAQLMKEIRKGERTAILQRTADGELTPEEAYAQIEAIRWLDRITYHVWRAAYHIAEQMKR